MAANSKARFALAAYNDFAHIEGSWQFKPECYLSSEFLGYKVDPTSEDVTPFVIAAIRKLNEFGLTMNEDNELTLFAPARGGLEVVPNVIYTAWDKLEQLYRYGLLDIVERMGTLKVYSKSRNLMYSYELADERNIFLWLWRTDVGGTVRLKKDGTHFPQTRKDEINLF